MSSSRRDFLKMGLAAGAVLGLSTGLGKGAMASWRRISFEECVSMNPQNMAQASGPVMDGWKYLVNVAGDIRRPDLRAAALSILEKPSATLASGLDEANVSEQLKKAGLLPAEAKGFLPPNALAGESAQPFWSAPGSGFGSHHAYPGGLVTHTALNVASAIALYDNYREVFGMELDRDVVIASELLHDLHKPLVFQWQENGACLAESPIAGTGAHHVLSLAEAMKRGLPDEMIVAQACAHDHPGTPAQEAVVAGWLRAACMIAGRQEAGVLAADGKTLPLPRRVEGFVCHIADHDWVISVPASQWLNPVLKGVAERRYNVKGADLDGRPFNNFRNYVLSQLTTMRLYNVWATEGEDGVNRLVGMVVAA